MFVCLFMHVLFARVFVQFVRSMRLPVILFILLETMKLDRCVENHWITESHNLPFLMRHQCLITIETCARQNILKNMHTRVVVEWSTRTRTRCDAVQCDPFLVLFLLLSIELHRHEIVMRPIHVNSTKNWTKTKMNDRLEFIV